MRKWLPTWAIPVLILMAVGTVWLRLTIVGTTYEVTQAEQLIRNQKHEKERAELRLAGLRSPRRLERLARERFGLSHPSVEQVVRLK